MATEHENWVDWARQSAEAEIRDLRVEWSAAIARAETAEAALAQCQHDLGTMANKVEQADATLDACWGKLDDMTAQRDALRIAYDDQAAGWNRAEAALATERIALREFAKGALLRTMHDLSEACWCAGWLHGMEYFLWNVVENGKATEWGMDNVYQRDVDDLRRLRELADGWWIWDEKKFETFISLDEMRRLAQAQP